jgi:hypothetical protein
MTTSETVTAFQRLNKKITKAEGLALSEKMRLENLTFDDLANHWNPKMLQAVASNHIDLNHINFVTQAPIHCNDCLICGALQAGV